MDAVLWGDVMHEFWIVLGILAVVTLKSLVCVAAVLVKGEKSWKR